MPHYFLAPFFLVPFEPAETQAVPAGGTAFVPQISASGSATAAVLIFPIAATVSGLSAPDVYAATTALAGTALSQGLLLSPAMAGSGVIATALEAGGIFVAPTHIGGLASTFYELALNESVIYTLIVVDGITCALPLNPEVVFNLAQRN